MMKKIYFAKTLKSHLFNVYISQEYLIVFISDVQIGQQWEILPRRKVIIVTRRVNKMVEILDNVDYFWPLIIHAQNIVVIPKALILRLCVYNMIVNGIIMQTCVLFVDAVRKFQFYIQVLFKNQNFVEDFLVTYNWKKDMKTFVKIHMIVVIQYYKTH